MSGLPCLCHLGTPKRGDTITCSFSAEQTAQIVQLVGRQHPHVVTVQEGVRQWFELPWTNSSQASHEAHHCEVVKLSPKIKAKSLYKHGGQ